MTASRLAEIIKKGRGEEEKLKFWNDKGKRGKGRERHKTDVKILEGLDWRVMQSGVFVLGMAENTMFTIYNF